MYALLWLLVDLLDVLSGRTYYIAGVRLCCIPISPVMQQSMCCAALRHCRSVLLPNLPWLMFYIVFAYIVCQVYGYPQTAFHITTHHDVYFHKVPPPLFLDESGDSLCIMQPAHQIPCRANFQLSPSSSPCLLVFCVSSWVLHHLSLPPAAFCNVLLSCLFPPLP